MKLFNFNRLQLFAVLVFAFAGVGVAAAAATTIYGQHAWFQNGATFKSFANRAQVTSAQKITNSSGCDVDYDFPALGPDGKVGGGASSFNRACLGTVIGDSCEVGSKAYADGGVPVDVELRAFVLAADTVTVHAHSQVNDAGVLNPVDAGYHVRCWSNQ